jgi:hypothetical protein
MCDEDPFCRSLSGQLAQVEDGCVRLGKLMALICLDDDEPCEERASQAVDPSGECRYFENNDCPGITRRAWRFQECVPWSAPACQ